MHIIYTKKFTKIMTKFLQKHSNLSTKVEKIFMLIQKDIYNPSLKLHELKGEYKEIHSISINLSHRITLILKVTKDQIIPLNIGTHDEVY